MASKVIYFSVLIIGLINIGILLRSNSKKKRIAGDSIFLLFVLTLPIIGRYESLALFIVSFLLMLYKIRIERNGLTFIYFLIILVGFLGIFNSIYISTSFRELLIVVSYFLISITATVLVYEFKEAFIEKAFRFIIVSALSVSCLNLIDLTGLFNFRKYIILLKTDNHFAYYIGGILITVIVMLYDKNKTFSKLNFLPIIVFATALISAGSRGSLVAIVATLGIFAIYNKKYKTVFVMALIFIIGYFNFDKLPYDIQRTLLSITNKATTFSNTERLAIWNASIQMIKDHPLVGVGIDNWRYYYLLPQYMQSVNIYPHAHNFYLQTGSEMGLAGLVLHILIFATSIYYSIYVFKRTKHEMRKCIALSSVMLIIFTAIYCMFNNPLFNSKPAMLFYIIVGLNAGIYKLTREEVKIDEEKSDNTTNQIRV
ncbi:O-antigen ligase family protein [Acetivibrio straminisolvens]|jgi:O-antigen ligase|uniref:Oligosaccharide repeat unit polymerase Wzy n=1 Tax=Acetivibrio straminisolvens JCM 21531 TaxID=1294263 RepID=W4V161_9FIRM|nr:O-antigen ligase family protein [Acetivibrio straminisolvens]GAE87230.1 oligosaccharide repeat unit polymerase Wzy [Acetivibrio straminisolvens JCM 21531]